MKIAFYCATPYQIFTAINLKYTFYSHDEVDIYILTNFDGADILAINIRKSNVFNSVFILDEKQFEKILEEKKKSGLFMYKVKVLVRKDKFLEVEYIPKREYDSVYIASWSWTLLQPLIYQRLYKQNRRVKLYYYEDGIGSYINHANINQSIQKKIVGWLFNFRAYRNNYSKWFVYRPEFVDQSIKRVERIPTEWLRSNKGKQILNEVFRNQNNMIKKRRMIFFEQPYADSRINDKKFYPMMDKLIKRYPNLEIKIHPRSDKEYNTEHKAKDITMWELYCIDHNIQNDIYITFHSSACITPKYIIDKEPTIIFLFEMEECKYLIPDNEDVVSLLYKLKNLYSNPDKVFFPKNYEELIKAIDVAM